MGTTEELSYTDPESFVSKENQKILGKIPDIQPWFFDAAIPKS